ncbi:MAG: hypothetical protein IJT98_08135 [Prevotella sp.]|nr:hypothetical protein [Prevotella sp.]
MKKIILLLVMIMAVGTVSAKKDRLYASFGTLNNANITSGNLSFTETTNANLVLFTFSSGELANYSTLHFKITKVSTTSQSGNLYRLQFRKGSTELKTTDNYTTEDLTLDLFSLGITLADVTDIRLLGPQYQMSVITLSVKDVYLEKATDNECMSIATTINSTSNKTAPFAWELGGNNPTIYARFGTSIEGTGTALFGSDYAGPTNGYYFDVTGYDYAIADLTAFTGGDVRYFNNDGSASGVITNATTYIAFSGTQHITTIKGGSNSSSKAITVNTIDFVKDFAAVSNTAFGIAASSASTIAYDRAFTVGRRSTVCLPFALTASEVTAAGTFYELTSVSNGTLRFTKVTETEAYKPYVFEAATTTPFANLTNKAITATPASYSTTVDGYTFQGTMAHLSLPSGVYGYNASTGEFSVTSGTDVTIDAFRAYITAPANARASLTAVFDNEPTDIETVNNEPLTMDQTYNLAGQRVGDNHRGIVIRNGRKILVR